MFALLTSMGGNPVTVDMSRCFVVEISGDKAVALFNSPAMPNLELQPDEHLVGAATERFDAVFSDGEGKILYLNSKSITGVFPLSEDKIITYRVVTDHTPDGTNLQLAWNGVSADHAKRLSSLLIKEISNGQ